MKDGTALFILSVVTIISLLVLVISLLAGHHGVAFYLSLLILIFNTTAHVQSGCNPVSYVFRYVREE